MPTYLTKRGTRYYIRRRLPADDLGISPGDGKPTGEPDVAAYVGMAEVMASLGTSDPKEAARLCRERSNLLDKAFREAAEAAMGLLDNQKEAAAELGCTVQEMHRRNIVAAASGSRTQIVPETQKDYVAPETKGLDALIKKWSKERHPTKPSEAAMVRAIERFKKLVGDYKVKSIRKKDVVRFKDKLLDSTTKQNTNYSLTQLNILCAFGVAQDWIGVNPCTGIRVKISKGDPSRLPFSEEQLNAIFASPLYAEGFRSCGLAWEAGYWLPLLGLFTGARVNELCQLAPKDVRIDSYRDTDGNEQSCYVLILTNEGEGQTLKNSGSRRRLPIHSELLSRGFAEYVESRRGFKRLFPVRKDSSGSHSAYWSGRWHMYMRNTIKITDPRYVFHSFRHTFKDVCRECGIDKGVRDAIQGHSEGGAAGGYGGEFYPLRPLVEAMKQYRVTGVKLPQPAQPRPA